MNSPVTEYAPTVRGLKRSRFRLGVSLRQIGDGIRPDSQGIETLIEGRLAPANWRSDGIRPDSQGIETSWRLALPMADAAKCDGIRPDSQGIETLGPCNQSH